MDLDPTWRAVYHIKHARTHTTVYIEPTRCNDAQLYTTPANGTPLPYCRCFKGGKEARLEPVTLSRGIAAVEEPSILGYDTRCDVIRFISVPFPPSPPLRSVCEVCIITACISIKKKQVSRAYNLSINRFIFGVIQFWLLSDNIWLTCFTPAHASMSSSRLQVGYYHHCWHYHAKWCVMHVLYEYRYSNAYSYFFIKECARYTPSKSVGVYKVRWLMGKKREKKREMNKCGRYFI